jgi:hypothetical protein
MNCVSRLTKDRSRTKGRREAPPHFAAIAVGCEVAQDLPPMLSSARQAATFRAACDDEAEARVRRGRTPRIAQELNASILGNVLGNQLQLSENYVSKINLLATYKRGHPSVHALAAGRSLAGRLSPRHLLIRIVLSSGQHPADDALARDIAIAIACRTDRAPGRDLGAGAPGACRDARR